MKFMAIVRGIIISGCCLFVSGTSLNAAKSDAKKPISNKTVDITETTPGAPQKVAASAPAVKKKAAQPVKGVVYLPLVSLSSYVSVGAQIFMMLITIAVSGLFGAWLMFRELAKRVQIFQDDMHITADSSTGVEFHEDSESFEMPEGETFHEADTQTYNQPVKKRTLFVSRKPNPDSNQPNRLTEQFEEPTSLAYNPPTATHRKAVKNNEGSKAARMPKKFLINEWFPVDR